MTPPLGLVSSFPVGPGQSGLFARYLNEMAVSLGRRVKLLRFWPAESVSTGAPLANPRWYTDRAPGGPATSKPESLTGAAEMVERLNTARCDPIVVVDPFFSGLTRRLLASTVYGPGVVLLDVGGSTEEEDHDKVISLPSVGVRIVTLGSTREVDVRAGFSRPDVVSVPGGVALPSSAPPPGRSFPSSARRLLLLSPPRALADLAVGLDQGPALERVELGPLGEHLSGTRPVHDLLAGLGPDDLVVFATDRPARAGRDPLAQLLVLVSAWLLCRGCPVVVPLDPLFLEYLSGLSSGPAWYERDSASSLTAAIERGSRSPVSTAYSELGPRIGWDYWSEQFLAEATRPRIWM